MADPKNLSEHAEGVRRLARRLVADADAAEDVAQEALLEGVRREPRPGWSLAAWLRGVVRNKARESRRAEKRRIRREGEVPRRPDAPSAADVVGEVEMHKHLLDAVLHLPDPYRTVIWLHFFRGQSARSIASDLELPLETVRTHVKRATERLRASLDAAHGNDGRQWRVALLPFVTSPNPLLGLLAEGLPLASKLKVIVFAAGIVLSTVLVWKVAGGGDDSSEGHGSHSLAPNDGSAAPPGGPTLALEGSLRADATSQQEPLPEPVDFATVDRRRDLHGVVVQRDGSPVAGARLEASHQPWQNAGLFTLRKEEAQVAATRTARDGTFVLRLRPGAAVDLRVHAVGLADAVFAQRNAGERVRLVLPPGLDLCVDLKDESGNAVSAGHVRLFGRRLGTVDYELEGLTDASGSTCFRGLVGGNVVTLAAKHPTLGSSGWTKYRLPDEGSARTSLVLPLGRTIEGRVVDAATGAPIAGAQVGSNWVAEHAATTDREGHFAYRGWTQKGTSVLTAHAPGYVRRELKVGEAKTLEFALLSGSRVTGRVVGPSGEAVVGAFVSGTGVPESTWVGLNAFPSDRTDASGRFTLDGVYRDCDLRLAVIAPALARHARRIAREHFSEGLLDLGDIRLEAGHWLRGVVVDSTGAPVPRTQVFLSGFQADRPPASRWDIDAFLYGLSGERFTDDLGRFAFEGLPPGPFRVLARPTDQPEEWTDVTIAPESDVENVRILIPSTRPLRVVVTTTDGKPIAGIDVSTMGRGTQLGGGTTDVAGEVALRLTSDVQHVSLGFSSDSFDRFLGTTWHVLQPDDMEVRFSLLEAALSTGRVLDEHGNGVARVTVTVVAADGAHLGSRVTDAEGKFRLPVPLGSRVTLEVQGSSQKELPSGAQQGVDLGIEGRLDSVGPGEVGLQLRVRPRDRVLRVRVVLPDGRAAAQAHVIVSTGQSVAGGGQTDADGRVTLERVSSRLLTVRASHHQAETLGLLEPVLAGVTANGQEVTLVFRAGVRMSGTLSDERGIAVPGVEVVVRVGNLRIAARRTDAGGRFSFVLDGEAAPTVELSAVTTGKDGVQRTGTRTGVRADATDVSLVLHPR